MQRMICDATAEEALCETLECDATQCQVNERLGFFTYRL